MFPISFIEGHTTFIVCLGVSCFGDISFTLLCLEVLRIQQQMWSQTSLLVELNRLYSIILCAFSVVEGEINYVFHAFAHAAAGSNPLSGCMGLSGVKANPQRIIVGLHSTAAKKKKKPPG